MFVAFYHTHKLSIDNYSNIEYNSFVKEVNLNASLLTTVVIVFIIIIVGLY